jgi:N-acetylmuramoyl-L-alanine amidase
VRNFLSFAIFIVALVCLNQRSTARGLPAGSLQQQAQQTATPQQQTPPAATPQPPSPQQPAAPISPAPPTHSGPVIVLNPAHGGTDTGARGGNGAIEKDIVLQYARTLRADLEHDNFRVVLTREDDSNPSYDDRAAMANTYRDVIFVSLHVASTGAAGTARVYYYRFASAPTGPTADVAATAMPVPPPAPSLTLWEEAQLPHVEASHRLADVLQGELAQRLSGSPIMASAVPVRELRSINAPAVAVEVSSVSVSDPNSLAALASPLAAAITHGLEAFRAAASAGANQ